MSIEGISRPPIRFLLAAYAACEALAILAATLVFVHGLDNILDRFLPLGGPAYDFGDPNRVEVVSAARKALEQRQLAYVHVATWALTILFIGYRLASRWRGVLRGPDRRLQEALLDHAIRREREVVNQRRRSLGIDEGQDPVGLALSGGGLRAAMAGLGFLRGLDEHSVLRKADYLSTVSGGGWAGGAYTIEARKPPDNVHDHAAALWRPERWDALKQRFSHGYLGASTRDVIKLTALVLLHLFWAATASLALVSGLALITIPFLWVAGALFGFGREFRADFPEPNALLEQFAYLNVGAEPVPLAEALVTPSLALGLLVVALVSGVAAAGLRLASRKRAWMRRHGGAQIAKLFSGLSGLLTTLFLLWLSLRFFRWRASWVGVVMAAGMAVLALALFYTRYRARPNRKASSGFQISALLALAIGAALFVLCRVTAQDSCFAGAKIVTSGFSAAMNVARSGSVETGLYTEPSSSNAMAPVEPGSVASERDPEQMCIPWVKRGSRFADTFPDGPLPMMAGVLVSGAGILILLWAIARWLPRAVSNPHRWWRDRIRSAFLVAPGGAADEDSLTSRGASAPLHLINTSFDARTSLSDDLLAGGGPFAFGPVVSGGKHVGFVDSGDKALDVSLSDAIAISAAVVNVVLGRYLPHAITPFFALLHVRLGRWVRNPGTIGVGASPGILRTNPVLRFFREIMGYLDEQGDFLQLADGGHEENLGLVTLVERGCKTIFVFDADNDPKPGGVRDAFERLGWRLQPGDPLAPVWRFSPPPHEDGKPVTVIIARLVLTDAFRARLAEQGGIAAFLRADSDFPRDSTLNQWFSPAQANAYHELGRLLAAEVAALAAHDEAA